jgi:hypothetical protein
MRGAAPYPAKDPFREKGLWEPQKLLMQVFKDIPSKIFGNPKTFL